MAITQSKKQSDLEKRLQLLKQQVYGKTNNSTLKSASPTFTKSNNTYNTHSDLAFLQADLIKITVFTVLILSAQLGLFYLIQNKIIIF